MASVQYIICNNQLYGEPGGVVALIMHNDSI